MGRIGSGEYGHKDGAGVLAKFKHPSGLVKDSNGNVFVADKYNHCIRKIDTNLSVSTLPGMTPNNGYRGKLSQISAIFSLNWSRNWLDVLNQRMVIKCRTQNLRIEEWLFLKNWEKDLLSRPVKVYKYNVLKIKKLSLYTIKHHFIYGLFFHYVFE